MKHDGSSMLDRLSCLVETVIGSFPVEDPIWSNDRRDGLLILVWLMTQSHLAPVDHMGPQPIIKDVIPPMMVCNRHILLFDDSVEGILGYL